MIVYHNPRCAKSRNACNLLAEKGVDFKTVEYLKNPLTTQDLTAILKKLEMPASALVRKTEAAYKELFKGKDLSEKEWIEAMIKYPKLMERPIVVKGKKAVVGRPTEKVLELLSPKP